MLIEEKKKFSAYRYLEYEFFNADTETLNKITDLYYDLYGYGPHKYLLNTYYGWKSGRVSTSGQTMYRIMECVPRCLSDEKRFYILKNEIIYFTEELHKKQQNKKISLSELNGVFENYFKEIENFNQSNIPYMASKHIFKEEEIAQFLHICKYTLIEKINLSYSQVKNDLILIKSKLKNFKTGVFNSTYKIDFLNTTINLSNINDTTLKFIEFNKQEIKPEGKYQQYAQQYILEEFMRMSFVEKEGALNYSFKSNDLDLLNSQYEEFKGQENETTLKYDFRGEGGYLNIVVVIKTEKKIKSLMFLTKSKLLLYASIFIGSIFFIVTFAPYKQNVGAWLVFGGIILTIYLITNFISEIQKLKELKLDLELYGK